MSWLRRFGTFLYDFLVGDAWELFVGPLVVLALAWLLLQMGVAAVLVGALVFVGVLVVAGLNLVLALRGSA
jgi:hypothetical protein